MAKIVGLTGGIGSGKSTLSAALRESGLEVLDTDTIARRIMLTDKCVRAKLADAFGEEVFLESGEIDKNYLSDVVFHNPQKMAVLNSIVHPAVFEYIVEYAIASDSKVVLAESAILFESGMNTICSAVITVSAPEDIRIERVMRRNGVSEQEVRQRMEAQWTDEQRERRADLVIRNGENAKISELCLQVKEFICNFAS